MSPWYRETAASRPLKLSYAAHLPNLTAAALKRIARLWVGKEASKLSKESCVQAICERLADATSVRTVLDNLSDFERAGLSLLKRYGQSAPTDTLATELLLFGAPLEASGGGYRSWSMQHGIDYRALNSLLHRGVVLPQHQNQGYGYPNDLNFDDYHYSPQVFSEASLLSAIEPIVPPPLSMQPLTEVGISRGLQPAEVALRLIGMVEALRKIGPIPLTTKGRPSKPFLSKLAKMLGIEATLAQDVLAPLHDATVFFFWLLDGLAFYRPLAHGDLDLTAKSTAFFEAPYEVQAVHWAQAYRTLAGWYEQPPTNAWETDTNSRYLKKFVGLRAALLLALGALPDPTGWYRIADLSASLFSRIGEHFSLGYMPALYTAFQATADAIAEERRKWQQQLQKNWERAELPWLRHALTGPLVHLGLVDIATALRQPAATLFRLTPLGRAVLYDALRSEQSAAPASPPMEYDGRCWIVQPNFDVVVYLDRASATQLAFIERVATRQPSSGATALYHITRDTVYAALESGITAPTLQETLRTASTYPLPDNVSQMLADWAARRERLTVYRTASLAEFPDQASRDAALASSAVEGSPVGERFIVLAAPTHPAAVQPARTVDYMALPVRCVDIAEDGEVHIQPAKADLLVHGTVAAWTEPGADAAHWRLTRASIERAIKAGWTAENILETLSQRALRPVPALLQVAVRAWAGERTLPRAVAVASDILLQIADPTVAQAIAGSTLLQPYLRGQLSPHTFLVRREAATALRKRLDELGLQVGSDLLFSEAH